MIKFLKLAWFLHVINYHMKTLEKAKKHYLLNKIITLIIIIIIFCQNIAWGETNKCLAPPYMLSSKHGKGLLTKLLIKRLIKKKSLYEVLSSNKIWRDFSALVPELKECEGNTIPQRWVMLKKVFPELEEHKEIPFYQIDHEGTISLRNIKTGELIELRPNESGRPGRYTIFKNGKEIKDSILTIYERRDTIIIEDFIIARHTNNSAFEGIGATILTFLAIKAQQENKSIKGSSSGTINYALLMAYCKYLSRDSFFDITNIEDGSIGKKRFKADEVDILEECAPITILIRSPKRWSGCYKLIPGTNSFVYVGAPDGLSNVYSEKFSNKLVVEKRGEKVIVRWKRFASMRKVPKYQIYLEQKVRIEVPAKNLCPISTVLPENGPLSEFLFPILEDHFSSPFTDLKRRILPPFKRILERWASPYISIDSSI